MYSKLFAAAAKKSMNEAAKRYFDDQKMIYAIAFSGFLTIFFVITLSIYASVVPLWNGLSIYLSIPILVYIIHIIIVYEGHSKRKEYFDLKKKNLLDAYTNDLEYFFINRETFLLPWHFYPMFCKAIFIDFFYGELAPANICVFRLDLFRQILFTLWSCLGSVQIEPE